MRHAANMRANVNTWAAIVALLENGLLSGPSAHYEAASRKVIKIAQSQIKKDLERYDHAVSLAND